MQASGACVSCGIAGVAARRSIVAMSTTLTATGAKAAAPKRRSALRIAPMREAREMPQTKGKARRV
jgi:hypothetical protein